jgi:16S rRNA (guanine527-N7)-methyltransferase
MVSFNKLYSELFAQLHKNQVVLAESIVKKLTEYLLLLQQWNQVYNLTSICKPSAMIVKHILDSLSISPYLQGYNILDVGTGAGLPGIPLALTQQDRYFYLLDSTGKKIRFLTHVIQKLAIANVTTQQIRVEQFHPEICFDTILSRAFSSLNDFVKKSQHLVCANGIFLAMKGQYPSQEISNLDNNFSIITIDPIQIVGFPEKRHVVVIKANTHKNRPQLDATL